MRFTILQLATSLLLFAGCSAETPEVTDDSVTPDEEISLDDDPIEDEAGKADAVTKSVVIEGTLKDWDVKTGTLPASAYWAWKVTVPAGGRLEFIAESTTAARTPVTMIYGPKAGTSWGSRLARVTGGGSKAVVPAAGTYLVVVAESKRRTFAFTVGVYLGTSGNACEDNAGTCVSLGPSGCIGGDETADARTFPCGTGLGVMCCKPPAANACEENGGRCVGLNPTACRDADHHVGDATNNSCGGGLGVMCCLPLCKPYCGAKGSRSEGWYNGCTGALIGWKACSTKTAECKNVGTRSEGWYESGTNGALIGWADCG